MIQFQVEGRPISWNKFYAGQFWATRKQLSDEWAWKVKVALVKYKITRVPFIEPVEIEFKVYVKRPIDCDNVVLKTYIDGLRDWGILPDDSPKWVRKISVSVIPGSEPERVAITIWTNIKQT